MIGADVRCLYRYPGGTVPAAEPRGLATLSVRVLDEYDHSVLSNVREISPAKEAQFRRRFDRGDRCWVAARDGVAVHYSWVQTTGVHSVAPGRRRTVADGELWIYDCLTHRSARGHRLYPWMLTRILDGHGCANPPPVAFIYANQSNTPSRKGILRAGFQPVGWLVTLILAGRRLPLPPLPHMWTKP